MKLRLVISSVMGSPLDPRTWSNAPAHLARELQLQGHEIVSVDSSRLARIRKAMMAGHNLIRGYPWNAVSRFAPARRVRGKAVARIASSTNCDIVLCTGTLDTPTEGSTPYAVWIDNTFALLQRSVAALRYSSQANAEIARLEARSLQGASVVLTFSDHVRDSVISDYHISPLCQ